MKLSCANVCENNTERKSHAFGYIKQDWSKLLLPWWIGFDDFCQHYSPLSSWASSFPLQLERNFSYGANFAFHFCKTGSYYYDKRFRSFFFPFLWRIPNSRWVWVFLKQSRFLSGIQFTGHLFQWTRSSCCGNETILITTVEDVRSLAFFCLLQGQGRWRPLIDWVCKMQKSTLENSNVSIRR